MNYLSIWFGSSEMNPKRKECVASIDKFINIGDTHIILSDSNIDGYINKLNQDSDMLKIYNQWLDSKYNNLPNWIYLAKSNFFRFYLGTFIPDLLYLDTDTELLSRPVFSPGGGPYMVEHFRMYQTRRDAYIFFVNGYMKFFRDVLLECGNHTLTYGAIPNIINSPNFKSVSKVFPNECFQHYSFYGK